MRRERGSVLGSALFVLLLVSVAAALLATHLQIQMRTARQQQRSVHLSALVDAALAEALASLHADLAFRGAPLHEFGGGEIRSVVERVATGRYTAWALGRYDGLDRWARADILILPGRPPRVTSWQLSRTP